MAITKDPFARIRLRAANVITRFGGPITFFTPTVPARPDGLGGWIPAVDAASFVGTAIETRGEPEGIDIAAATAGLVLKDPVVVLVAAEGLNGVPLVDMQMDWSNKRRVIRNVQAVAPNGQAIYYVVVGDV